MSAVKCKRNVAFTVKKKQVVSPQEPKLSVHFQLEVTINKLLAQQICSHLYEQSKDTNSLNEGDRRIQTRSNSKAFQQLPLKQDKADLITFSRGTNAISYESTSG